MDEIVHTSDPNPRLDRQVIEGRPVISSAVDRNKPLPSMPPADADDWDDLDELHEEIERIQKSMDQSRLASRSPLNGDDTEELSDLYYLRPHIEDDSRDATESLSSFGLVTHSITPSPTISALSLRSDNILSSTALYKQVNEKPKAYPGTANRRMHSSRQRAASAPKSPLLRSDSNGEPSSLPYMGPRKSAPLPDPANFPDPYPLNTSIQHPVPALSSAGSSSASTRSSAFTNSGSTISTNITSGDYSHVRVASESIASDEIDFGIAVNAVAELIARDSKDVSPTLPFRKLRPDMERVQHSEILDFGQLVSKNESNAMPAVQEDKTSPALKRQPSYDISWQRAIGSRTNSTFGATSEEETDYGDHHFVEGADEDDDEDENDDNDDDSDNEERTTAIIIAESGKGMIIQNDGGPVTHLIVHPGTTHLLVGGSSTPNSIPSFLSTALPQITNSLLALDISANFLVSLPPILASCQCLEELNIASNPLRVLPIFLANLTSLCVLIADSTGITTIPQNLSTLGSLHTLSIRRNKMNSLPSWICLLSSLRSLYIDGNPFQGPWRALVEPLLTKSQVSPIYPPSTPIFPQLSASSTADTVNTDFSDTDELRDLRSKVKSTISLTNGEKNLEHVEEEQTITSSSALLLERSGSFAESSIGASMRKLSRTRTVPSQPSDYRSRPSAMSKSDNQREQDEKKYTYVEAPLEGNITANSPSPKEMRRMRSADELRRVFDKSPITSSGTSQPDLTSAQSPSLTLSVSQTDREDDDKRPAPTRFASLGVSSRRGTLGMNRSFRPELSSSLWNDPSHEEETNVLLNNSSPRPLTQPYNSPLLVSSGVDLDEVSAGDIQNDALEKSPGEEKEKPTSARRWGFLKKMSMGKMRVSDSPSPRPNGRPPAMPISVNQSSLGSASAPAVPQLPVSSLRDSNLTSTLNSTNKNQTNTPSVTVRPPFTQSQSVDASSYIRTSSGLLAPPSAGTSRASKRRSFLRIDGLPSSLAIPDSASFLPGISAANGDELEDDYRGPAVSPISPPSPRTARKREQERIKDGEARALRSVMAYLKDMNDLTLTQTNTISVYGPPTTTERSRRPTLGENSLQSEVSFSLSDSPVSSTGTVSSNQLRSPESVAGNRSASSSVTMSVATTDSTGSGNEDRKHKYDKGKQALIVREIIETERTYVKGLQELVDIYVKPASAPVTLLGNVGVPSSKETVVPATDRKIVFGGLEALFSFHKESFLPALEQAAAPLSQKRNITNDADVNDLLLSRVAIAVGRTFVSHAAFMKMYSTYINNFDNSVQRIRHWMVSSSSSRPGTSGGLSTSMSPSSSSAQLATLGMAMSAVSSPASLADGSSSSRAPPLSANQRKRIKTYLKRCRANPRHSQLNLEGYLLLPVQRIPRYRLLLEELVRSTPPEVDVFDDPLDRALSEISSLATNMNEGKRDAESRHKLVHWQGRIRGKFPSPLVQPHRRLIMDGRLLLTRVVRKQTMSFEVFNAEGDASSVQVECLAPELTPRPLIGVLCNDLLVLCRDSSDGQDPNSPVDLWAVLRMQTLPQPASIVHGNSLRLVDNKAILYFEAPSTSDALTWFRAINLHIPSSKP